MGTKRFISNLAAACLVVTMGGVTSSFAQQPSAPKSGQPSQRFVLIPGAMTGLESTGPTGYRRLCSPLSVGLYEWRIRWVERWVKPSEAQKAPLDDLVTASAKAKETITAACPRETVETTSTQLEVTEKRVAGILEALKIIRPVYDKFYTPLDSREPPPHFHEQAEGNEIHVGDRMLETSRDKGRHREEYGKQSSYRVRA